VWKLPTSTQLFASWLTDSLYMVALPYTGVSRYHNCSIDDTSPEYFGYQLVFWSFFTYRCIPLCLREFTYNLTTEIQISTPHRP
jgi:hypothetical protein